MIFVGLKNVGLKKEVKVRYGELKSK